MKEIQSEQQKGREKTQSIYCHLLNMLHLHCLLNVIFFSFRTVFVNIPRKEAPEDVMWQVSTAIEMSLLRLQWNMPQAWYNASWEEQGRKHFWEGRESIFLSFYPHQLLRWAAQVTHEILQTSIYWAPFYQHKATSYTLRIKKLGPHA